MKRNIYLIVAMACMIAILPQISLASGGITEFSSPLEKVVNTITGPMGKYIAIAGISLAGILYVVSREDISGTMKGLITTVLAISIIAGGPSIVNQLFSFSGAVV